ncbi:unnamed protein product, partial [Heterotrigona itama]
IIALHGQYYAGEKSPSEFIILFATFMSDASISKLHHGHALVDHST